MEQHHQGGIGELQSRLQWHGSQQSRQRLQLRRHGQRDRRRIVHLQLRCRRPTDFRRRHADHLRRLRAGGGDQLRRHLHADRLRAVGAEVRLPARAERAELFGAAGGGRAGGVQRQRVAVLPPCGLAGLGTLHHHATGAVRCDRAYAPFGESYAAPGPPITTSPGRPKMFRRGIYDFLFRQHSPGEGRWLMPDPAGLAAVDPTNPQTWNRYAYVGNQPLNRIDPLGLCEFSYLDVDPQTGYLRQVCIDPIPLRSVFRWRFRWRWRTPGSHADYVSTHRTTREPKFPAANNGPGFLTKLNTCVVNNAKNYEHRRSGKPDFQHTDSR